MSVCSLNGCYGHTEVVYAYHNQPHKCLHAVDTMTRIVCFPSLLRLYLVHMYYDFIMLL